MKNLKFPHNPTMAIVFFALAALKGVRLAASPNSPLFEVWIVLMIAFVIMAIVHLSVPFAEITTDELVASPNYFSKKRISFDDIASIEINNNKVVILSASSSRLIRLNLKQLGSAARQKFLAELRNRAPQFF